jgi:hypothetical protein
MLGKAVSVRSGGADVRTAENGDDPGSVCLTRSAMRAALVTEIVVAERPR